MPLTNKVCANCWVTSTLPDLRWSQIDAKFCMRCGEGLTDKCGACSEPILLNGRFVRSVASCTRNYMVFLRILRTRRGLDSDVDNIYRKDHNAIHLH
jgi:hypothetical protein